MCIVSNGCSLCAPKKHWVAHSVVGTMIDGNRVPYVWAAVIQAPLSFGRPELEDLAQCMTLDGPFDSNLDAIAFALSLELTEGSPVGRWFCSVKSNSFLPGPVIVKIATGTEVTWLTFPDKQ